MRITVRNIAAFNILVVMFVACDPPGDRLVKAFQTDMKQSVDPQQLQEWAQKILPAYRKGDFVPQEQWPLLFQPTNQPSWVWIFECQNGRPAVVLSWGGGFERWGIIVGNTNCLFEENIRNQPTVKWTNGVYFFHQKT